MDYALFDARRAGVERVVFVIRRDIEAAFRDRIGAKYERWLSVDYAFQELDDLPPGFPVPADRAKPWGTGHAVLAARHKVAAPFLVINADDFYGAEAFRRLAAWLATEGGATAHAMVAFRLANTLSEHGAVSRGVCAVGEDGLLRGVAEFTGLVADGGGVTGAGGDAEARRFTGGEPVSMNFWGFRPSIFAALAEGFEAFLRQRGAEPAAEFYLPSLVDALVAADRATVRVLETPDRWFGVTYREDREAAAQKLRALVAAGAYPADLWSGR
jgi:NDP-sugar pyrophosphorylase family protein